MYFAKDQRSVPVFLTFYELVRSQSHALSQTGHHERIRRPVTRFTTRRVWHVRIC